MAGELKLVTPSGIKDWAPGAAALKRFIEGKLAKLFQAWGYQEVITGTLEFENVIARGLSEEEKNQLYRFFGREGEALTLRPDMTTPIARFVASQFRSNPLPLRLFYTANVFRHEKIQAGRYREFYQAGVELIGSETSRADAEMIILASEALQEVGVCDFKIGIGQIQLLNSILDSCHLYDTVRAQLKRAIGEKDYVTADTIINESSIKGKQRDLLNNLSRVYTAGEFLNIFDKIAVTDIVREQLKRMKEVLEILEAAGLKERIFVDLGITRDFEYYTGTVFEIYSPALGFPICGGGRYDKLLKQFGYECPATGFALGIERILLVLETTGRLPSDSVPRYLVGGFDFRRVLGRAKELRAKGYYVEVDVNNMSKAQLEKYAEAKGISNIEIVDGREGIGTNSPDNSDTEG